MTVAEIELTTGQVISEEEEDIVLIQIKDYGVRIIWRNNTFTHIPWHRIEEVSETPGRNYD